ncbi:hypothetical protein TNCV_3820051 [Trichonephila clavipes]|uniref:Uncharacterized protein n=1 Tax=Trichonephila clavipes TaxID=2585209 RepID=A0A8X6R351_TRICX|nr:hypothetical protein TNCV_3820051 [Trichonephila clavipes]
MTPPHEHWLVKKEERPFALSLHSISHSADMPIPDPPKKYNIVRYVEENEFIRPGTSHDQDFEAEDLNELPRLNQEELSNLVRYLDFPKQKAELLASRLQYYSYQA